VTAADTLPLPYRRAAGCPFDPDPEFAELRTTRPVSRVSINGGSSQALAADRIVTGLTNGSPYRFQVQACNQVGCGPLSSESNTIVPVAVM